MSTSSPVHANSARYGSCLQAGKGLHPVYFFICLPVRLILADLKWDFPCFFSQETRPGRQYNSQSDIITVFVAAVSCLLLSFFPFDGPSNCCSCHNIGTGCYGLLHFIISVACCLSTKLACLALLYI